MCGHSRVLPSVRHDIRKRKYHPSTVTRDEVKLLERPRLEARRLKGVADLYNLPMEKLNDAVSQAFST